MSKHDAERLQLLEAVAEAAQAHARMRQHMYDTEYLEYIEWYGGYMSEHWLAVLQALAALEALDKKKQP